ncbi:MAG: hypothetical protein C4523_07875 [Myxococcales bacterium]|nr:MAG: hypothetical protein C4523_07875 [Myxococcales bacterium]
MTDLLQRLFKIRKGEFVKTFLMFLYAFNWTAAFIIGRITKDTLFLTESRLSWLPYMYIAVAVAVGGVSVVYSKLAARKSLRKIILGTFSLLLLGLSLFRYLLSLNSPDWVYPALYIFIELMGVMLMIQFWTFANELFNSREGKRLFGVIVGGQVLANLYSFPIKSLKNVIGIENLLYVCIISVLVCLWIYNHLSKRYRLETAQRERLLRRPSREQVSPDATMRVDVFSGLQKSIILLSLVTILASTFVDYQFKVTAKHHFAGEGLADYFFAVYAYGGLLACLVQLFFTSRILEKFGIFIGLLLLPTLLFGGSALSLAFIGYLGVTFTKGGELVTRYSVTETSTNLLYQPLPPALRRRTKALADGVTRPIAQAGAGLIFVALSSFLAINDPGRINSLSWAILGLVLVWTATLWIARRRYIEALLISSDWRARHMKGEADEDEAKLAVSRLAIQKALVSGDAASVLNAIEVIPLTRSPSWEEAIKPLLTSPHPDVRVKTTEFFEKSGNRKYSHLVLPLFADPDETVRAAAIRAYCELEHDRAVPLIARHIDDPASRVKAAAIAGLIQHGGLEGILASTQALKTMLASAEASERENGARVLGYIKIKNFYQPLARLIDDPDPTVQNAAIFAAGEMQSEELIPALLYKLQRPQTRAAAVAALSRFSTSLLPRLTEALALPHLPPGVRQSIPIVLGQIESPAAYDLLEPLLETKDDVLRSNATRAMQKLFARLSAEISPRMARIQNVLHAELENYYQLLAYIRMLRDRTQDAELLVGAFQERADEALKRAFYLLGILYPRDQIEIVSYNLQTGTAERRAIAIEIIDNICDQETKRYLLPILDAGDLAETVAAGRKLFQLDAPEPSELLARLIAQDHDDWLLTCAIHAAGELQLKDLADDVRRHAGHESPLVRETVLYAASRLLDADGFTRLTGLYLREPDGQVRGYLEALAGAA